MWLKDFLPKDIKTARIMTFGYESSLTGTNEGNARIRGYRQNFIQNLENARRSAKVCTTLTSRSVAIGTMTSVRD